MADQQKAASPVEFVRQEVLDRLQLWERIRAAVDGEECVKKLGDKVLPRPNPLDTSIENVARYNNYLQRAVWYNASGRTLSGLAGYVFAKEPVVKLPDLLLTIEDNVDGSGVTLNQQAKAALTSILSLGRAGLLVDYPSVEAATSRQQLLDGNVSPTIVLYQPEQITNWRTSYVGARAYLDLIVLKECHSHAGADEFELVTETQYRVLTRTPEGVTVRIYRRSEATGDYTVVETMAPRDKTGKPLAVIPFTFLGSVNNDDSIDPPPLQDLVVLNLAHFRNSADYEESSFLVGQPTPWISGLTESWVKDVLKGSIQLGSRAIIPLPQGGQAGLLQATANSMPMEAMTHKEAQMVALGAKLVEQKEVQQTATEVGLNHSSEVSTLTAAATNIFLGYKQALAFCAQYVGTDTASIEFDLTEPLTKDIVSPEQAQAITAMWQGGLIDFEEARYALKKAGLAWKDDKVVKQAVENDGLRESNNPPPPAPTPNVPPAQ